jgi:hypothetical protein
MNLKGFQHKTKKIPIQERRDKMTDFEILMQLKEQYDSTQDTSDLKHLIDNFLEQFPVKDQSK